MDNKVSIYNIAEILTEKTGKEAAKTEKFIEELIALINDGITKDGFVKIKGIGTFKVLLVKERESVHVNTGERIVIPAHHKLSFLPDKSFKDRINKPFAFFKTIETNDEEINKSSKISPLDDEDSEKNEEIADDDNFTTEKNTAPIVPSTPLLTSKERNKEMKDTGGAIEKPTEQTTKKAGKNEKKSEVKTDTWSEERAIGSNPMQEDSERKESQDINKIIIKEEEMNENNKSKTQDTKDVLKSKVVKRPQQKKTKKSSNTYLYVILGLLLLILVGSLFLYFYNSRSYDDMFNGDQNKPMKSDTFVLPGDSSATEETEAIDTTALLAAGAEKGNVENNDEKKTSKTSKASNTSKNTSASVTTRTSSSDHQVMARVKMQSGQRLTLLAQKYYGNKIFWVYIYDFNKSKVADPDHISVGMEILIPAKEVYAIDAKSRASIQRAKELQSQIMSKK